MNQSYLFVCIANFCRSPVAEKILKHHLLDNSDINSAGLIDYDKKFMHKYSQEFLKEIGIEDIEHNTKQITKDMIKKTKIIFCMDKAILKELRSQFPESSAKMRLIMNKDIEDPINLEKNQYKTVLKEMNFQIEELVKKLDLLT